jgi:sporulation protein YlmC with PRC-barrel domain
MSGEAGEHRARFKIGARVEATDGSCGKLAGVIVDPVARKLTHLIVQPRRHHGLGRLAPVESVEADGDPIRLGCTTAEFEQLDEAEETHFVQPTDDYWTYAGGEAYAWPHYDAGLVGGMGAGAMSEVDFGRLGTPEAVVSDKIPAGEVEVRRGDPVHASDGWIGKVKGLIVDPADNHVTHVLISEGHLFGHKQVAIPIGKTARIEDEIRVEMTKQEIEALPAIEPG